MRSRASQVRQSDRPGSPRIEARSSLPRTTRARGRIIHRLTLQNTQWQNVDEITASGDGAHGVLFLKDPAGPKLVVKPNVRGAEEQLAARVHAAVEQGAQPAQANDQRWSVRALGVRIAQQADRDGINAAFARVFPPPPFNLPAGDRRGDLHATMNTAGVTTMIQEAAGASTTFGAAVSARTGAGGHMTRSLRGKSKVRAESPLKILVKQMEFATALGRMAAVDIFLGNEDRLAQVANTENFMVDPASRTVFPIDNVLENSFAMFAAIVGDPHQPNFAAWAARPMTVLLHARNFNRIAASTIRVGPGYDAAAEDVQSTLGDELAGRTGGQQQLVQAKLLRHIGEIRAAFATGVQAGLTAILSPAMRDTAEGFAAEVTRMYRARRLYLLGHGLTVQEAWADAAHAQQAPALAGVGRHGAAGFH